MSDATATRDWRQLKERAQSIAELINNAILTVRRISTELRPGLLDAVGLTAAIEWQAKEFENRTGIKCRLGLPDADVILDQNRSVAVFRIFQEILTNVTRHAQASEVNIILEAREADLFLEARDNGRGIRASEFSNPKSLGLLGMRERTLLLGGEFNIRGVQGKGTTVTVRIPLETKPNSDSLKTPSSAT
jgi:signal transduction histidine kinase